MNTAFPAVRCHSSSTRDASGEPPRIRCATSAVSSRVNGGTSMIRVGTSATRASTARGSVPSAVRTVAITRRSASRRSRETSAWDSASHLSMSSTARYAPTFASRSTTMSACETAGRTRCARLLPGTSASAATPHDRAAFDSAAMSSRRCDLPTPASPAISVRRSPGSRAASRIAVRMSSRIRCDESPVAATTTNAPSSSSSAVGRPLSRARAGGLGASSILGCQRAPPRHITRQVQRGGHRLRQQRSDVEAELHRIT